MSKHTPTPWKVIGRTCYDANGMELIRVNHKQSYSADKDRVKQRQEALERAAICVNAMEGLTNEEVTNLRTNADQEKEKIAVAFAEWKDKNTHCIGFSVYNTPIFKINDRKNDIFSYQYSDLYQYFINNVYNQ